jgi:uncharacterized protein
LKRYAHCRILVFAKAPVVGSVKTRLEPALGARALTQLQERLIRHTLNTALQLAQVHVELWCAPDTTHAFFQQCARDFNIRLRTQTGDDLGERMGHAIQDALAGDARGLLIGTDCPCLTPQYLAAACEALSQPCSIVFGPAEDGGYGMVGMARFVPEVFTAIDWGGTQVMQQTRERLAKLQVAWQELPELWDVDRPEDLQRLRDTRELAHLLAGLKSEARAAA